MTVKFKITEPACQSYGRGLDQCRSGAHWGVFVAGVQVATLLPAGCRRYMDSTSPIDVVQVVQGRMQSLKRIYGGVRKAKQWARVHWGS